MQIAPLSLITKPAQSPSKVIKHNDSLIFSITSEKFNSRKETLLLEESKEMVHLNEEPVLRDYFKIQDKIKSLEQKVQNIKTNYCESEGKSPLNFDHEKENKPEFINLEFPQSIYSFPQEIYSRKAFVQEDDQAQVGKIKRKKSKYYTGIEQKTRVKSRSHSKNQDSIISTKRNNLTTCNVNDFSVYRGKNASFRHNQTAQEFKRQSRERSSSFSVRRNPKSFIQSNKIISMQKVKHQLQKNRLSNQKVSKKSRQSQRRLSVNKEQTRKIKQQNETLLKQIAVLKQKLKKSQTVKERQKQTISKQKQQIEELKGFLEEFLKRNNQVHVQKLISAHQKQDGKIAKLRLLR